MYAVFFLRHERHVRHDTEPYEESRGGLGVRGV
jgi:hypothetical protein